MNFWEHFIRVLPRRPKQALAALYWHVTRRKIRARNRLRVASADLPFAYAVWISTNENNPAPAEVQTTVDGWQWQPRFLIVLHESGQFTTEQLDRSVGSVDRQAYPHKTIHRDTRVPFRDAISRANADYVIPLRVGDMLSREALFRWGQAAVTNPGASILFGDQDQLDEQGRRTRPWFKPRWNEEMFFAQDYLGAAVAIESGLALTAAKKAEGIDEFRLRSVIEANGKAIHVPHIMCHVDPSNEDPSDRIATVRNHLQAFGATCGPGPFGTVKVDWPLPNDLPLVSIIVPTKDKVELLRPCVDSVLQRTEYANFEILVVDNGSTEKRTAEYLATASKNPKVRVLRYQAPYNFSAINNFAIHHTLGTFVCLLNNDTEVIEPSWLNEMMRYAVRDEVGAVGAKLLYEDGSIQHAGVVIGIGEAAGHAHRYLPPDDPGYFRQAHVTHYVSAVTAACLVVEKKKFVAVGGLDEAELAIAFNDVDLCLKLGKAGWRNVYTPHAVLLHHESKSRGKDSLPDNIQRYRCELAVLQERWKTKTFDDPLHNPNLDKYTETYVIRL